MALFHILNRGVDKRDIFLDEKDYLRFIHDLYEFNDKKPALNVGYFFNDQYIDLRSQYIDKNKKREFIVNIVAFCLMPNHYHLILDVESKDEITKFIRKLNIGYAKYFNHKNKRSGSLFESRTKKILIDNQAHFIHLPYYIHCNPLDLKYPKWRDRELKNPKNAIKFLENYRWSSHMDYLGIKNFPSVTQREFLLKFFGGEGGYKESLEDWLRDLDIKLFEDYTLEKR